MITFHLSAILIPYGIAVVFILLFSLINIYHIVVYGATTFTSFAVTFVFLAGMTFIFFFTGQELKNVDWNIPITIVPPFTNLIGLTTSSLPH